MVYSPIVSVSHCNNRSYGLGEATDFAGADSHGSYPGDPSELWNARQQSWPEIAMAKPVTFLFLMR